MSSPNYVAARATPVKAAGGARGGSQTPVEVDPPAFRFRGWRRRPETEAPEAEVHKQGVRVKRRAVIVAACLAAIANVAAAAVLTSGLAPDFTLHSVAGSNLRLREQRGQVVMLNFWASWCGPCRQEMPQLDRLYEKYHASGFQLLGVNVDDDSRNATGVSSKLGLHFPVLLDTQKKVSRLYDLSTMPSTVLIDRDGRVRYIHRGYRDGYVQTYEEQIRELLRE
jgi:peroxiredoxin